MLVPLLMDHNSLSILALIFTIDKIIVTRNKNNIKKTLRGNNEMYRQVAINIFLEAQGIYTEVRTNKTSPGNLPEI